MFIQTSQIYWVMEMLVTIGKDVRCREGTAVRNRSWDKVHWASVNEPNNVRALSSKTHSSCSRPRSFTQASPPNTSQLSQSGSNPVAAKYAHCLMLLLSVRSDGNLASSCDSHWQKSLLEGDNRFEPRQEPWAFCLFEGMRLLAVDPTSGVKNSESVSSMLFCVDLVSSVRRLSCVSLCLCRSSNSGSISASCTKLSPEQRCPNSDRMLTEVSHVSLLAVQG